MRLHSSPHSGNSTVGTKPKHATVTIVGAGPRGLSVALYLQRQSVAALRDVQIIERQAPAASWSHQAMPPAMRLRSPALHDLVAWGDPWSTWTFAHYRAERLGMPQAQPYRFDTLYEVPRAQYHAYIEHVAARLPNIVSGAEVVRMERSRRNGADGLDLFVSFEGGIKRLHSRFVIVASGSVGYGGAEFRYRPPALVKHLREGAHYRHTHGFTPEALAPLRHVAVLGGGQSAAEAVQRLLDETAIPAVTWIARSAPRAHLYPVPHRFFNASYCASFAALSASERRQIVNEARAWGPTISPPLHERLLQNPQLRLRTRFGEDITQAKPLGERLALKVREGRMLEVDHLVLGTGYRYDVQKLPFLTPLFDELELDGRLPRLDVDFRAVVAPGRPPLPLYFTGAAALLRDGPRQLFINSSGATAARIVAALQREDAAAQRGASPPLNPFMTSATHERSHTLSAY